MLSKSAKSRSKSKSKASAGSSTSVLSSDQDVLVTSIPSHVIRSSIHKQNNMTMPTSASAAAAAYRHRGRRKEEEDAIFSSFASKLRPITIPSRSTCRSSRGYDSSPAPSTILSAEEEEDVNESSCSQRTSLITINLQSATTFMDLCSTSSSPPLPPSSDHHVKKSSVNSNLFQHYHCWYHDQPNSSTTTESTAAARLFSDGLTKPGPNPPASASGSRSTSTNVANGSAGDDVCDYAPRSPSSVISSVFLEPLATNAAQAPAHDNRITEKKVLLAQEEGDHEIDACESDQNDSESSFIKYIEYINCRTRTHDTTIMMGDTEGAAAVDEAIAWAKEKFWNGSGPAAGV